MSTRGAIAVITDAKKGNFEGVYHHWDSYPSGLGATLFHLRNGHFRKNTKAMLKVLIKDHNAWSTINEADFTKEPGYGNESAPQCYCHGQRSEKNKPVTQKSASACGCEYVYGFDKGGDTMIILSSYRKDGGKMIGAFGCGDPKATWKPIAVVDLDGEEPDWKKIG